MLEFLMMANNKCRNCGNDRIEVCECCLPCDMKKLLSEVELKGRYLYCKNCDEFSIICEPILD